MYPYVYMHVFSMHTFSDLHGRPPLLSEVSYAELRAFISPSLPSEGTDCLFPSKFNMRCVTGYTLTTHDHEIADQAFARHTPRDTALIIYLFLYTASKSEMYILL